MFLARERKYGIKQKMKRITLSNRISLMFMLLAFLVFETLMEAKVLIMTHAYNKPEYIPWQYWTFKKFFQDEYEFIVFNDAPNSDLSDNIQNICHELDISCIEVPQFIHFFKSPYLPGSRNPLGDPSAECADTIQYMLDTLGFDYPG